MTPEFSAALRLGHVSSGRIFDRLEGVKGNGDGEYKARCPAHDDRSPSLSIKVCDDGRTLLHCHAGCHVESVLKAAGLDFADLFPESVKKPRIKPKRPAREVLQELDHESLVVAIVAADMLEEKTITGPVFERLATAVSRIGKARDEISPARHRP